MARRAISYAVLQDYLQQKRRDPHTPPLDLSECDLRGFDLRDLDLSGANLSHADLTGAILGNTNLHHTILNMTRFADVSLGALVAAGIKPVPLLEQHRQAIRSLSHSFHFSPTPEHRRAFALSADNCMCICQVHITLPWQQLDDQAVISALYPGRIWEEWLTDTAIRPVLDWIMTHPEHIPTLHRIIAGHHNYLAGLLRSPAHAQNVERLLAETQWTITYWEKNGFEMQQREQREKEEAMWLAQPIAYPLAPWNDSPSARQITSRPELVAILKASSYYDVSEFDVRRFEYGCLVDGEYFLYHVGEPVQPLDMVDKSTTPLRTHFKPFFALEQFRQTISSWSEAPSDFFCSHIAQPLHGMTLQPQLASSLSSGNLWQGAREHLTRRPSSSGSADCHGRGTVLIALRYQLATSISWLHERNS